MRLRELINKLDSNSDCEITISTLCDEYNDGVEALKNEDWYKESRDCNVESFHIGINGHCMPEICISIER